MLHIMTIIDYAINLQRKVVLRNIPCVTHKKKFPFLPINIYNSLVHVALWRVPACRIIIPKENVMQGTWLSKCLPYPFSFICFFHEAHFYMLLITCLEFYEYIHWMLSCQYFFYWICTVIMVSFAVYFSYKKGDCKLKIHR